MIKLHGKSHLSGKSSSKDDIFEATLKNIYPCSKNLKMAPFERELL